MEFIVSTCALIGIAVILASSFNLIIGYGGLMSIAHPIFFALGAYASALSTMWFGIPVAAGIVLGVGLAAIVSVALAVSSLRISGDYLVIASLGLQLGLLQVIKNLDWTGGPGGLSGIPPLVAFSGAGSQAVGVAIIWLCTLATVGLVAFLVSGANGRLIVAMRDDEEAFRGLGRNALRLKIVLFTAGSGCAGLAGALYAHQFQFVAPEQFGIAASALILTMVVIGGAGTLLGPIFGALILQLLPQGINLLRLPSSLTGPVQGLIFTGLVLVFLFLRPQGLVGLKRRAAGP
jgi:branched-chain amino acid transport system permease protein